MNQLTTQDNRTQICADNKVLESQVLVINGPPTEVVHTEISNPYPETLTVTEATSKQLKLNPIVVRNFKKTVKAGKKGRSQSDNGCIRFGSAHKQ